MKARIATLLAAALAAALPAFTHADDLAWPAPTAENRLATRWWWLGNAVDQEGITKQLEQFHAAGLGGVEICPIYGVMGAENKYLQFLSPEWMNMLSHTYRETKRLDMFVDMTTGTGWPFGGPWVTPEMASASLTLKTFDHYPTAEELPKGTLVTLMLYPPPGTPGGAPSDVTGKQVKAMAGSRFVAAITNAPIQKVKRAAPGGEGNVVDPYSTDSLQKYLEKFDTAFEGFQDDIPRGQFHDSFEYYGATWTPKLFEEFQKRRGYDLKPHLRELAGEGDKDAVARIRHDYRETLSDLHEAYMKAWTEWSHQHGSKARNQAHGGPGNLIDVYAGADIPECEIFHLYDESQLPMLKLASSAAHLTGKKLASSESFTWLGEHFSVPLSEVKPAADFLFLAGVNNLFLHGIPYSPPDAAWPGWQFYASVNFGPQGGLWKDMPAFAAYVARCQSILQANKPSNDILLYAPWHQFWTEMDPQNLMTQFKMPDPWMKPFPFYDAATKLADLGYGYDEVSDKLLKDAKVNDGAVALGNGGFAGILLPKTSVIPVETFQKMLDLVKDGTTLFVQDALPTDVPGFHDVDARRAQLRALTASLEFKNLGPDVRVAALGKGAVIMGTDLGTLLNNERVHVNPEIMRKKGLRFLRRLTDDGLDYFVVNRSDRPVDGVPLSMKPQSAVILDPRFDNRAGVARVLPNGEIDLHLEPGEAYFIRTFMKRSAEGKPWTNPVPAAAPVALAGTWNVTFIDGGPALPKPFTSTTLASWTEQDDSEAQRFAGTAKYTLEFQKPQGDAADYLLDLGKVADSARVALNGKPLGALWAAPFRLPLASVGGALQPGKNTLDIEVTNVAANRIRDMDQRGVQWKIFKDINVVDTGYKPMDASKWPVRPAGLLGPVTLTPLKAP
jgi:hypothetical protein